MVMDVKWYWMLRPAYLIGIFERYVSYNNVRSRIFIVNIHMRKWKTAVRCWSVDRGGIGLISLRNWRESGYLWNIIGVKSPKNATLSNSKITISYFYKVVEMLEPEPAIRGCRIIRSYSINIHLNTRKWILASPF